MRIFDKKFRMNLHRYLFQCGLATLSILIILLFLNVFEETAIIASLGASGFIVFTMPNAFSAKPRPLIGGYIVGIVIGVLLKAFVSTQVIHDLPLQYAYSVAGVGAVSVGIAMFLMVATDTEHPPAAGMALALILNDWNYSTILFIFTSVLLMSGFQRLLKPKLLDLI